MYLPHCCCDFVLKKLQFLGRKVSYFCCRIEFSVSIELISNFCFVLSQRLQSNNPAVSFVALQIDLHQQLLILLLFFKSILEEHYCKINYIWVIFMEFMYPSDLNDQHHFFLVKGASFRQANSKIYPNIGWLGRGQTKELSKLVFQLVLIKSCFNKFAISFVVTIC